MKKDRVYYPIDSGALFYPVIRSKKSESLFTFTLLMLDDVDPEKLSLAVEEALKRFPTMAVRLRAGYSRHYFEHNTLPLPIKEYDGKVLAPINRRKNNYHNIRISYIGKKIVFDFFHAVTDANGALRFIKNVCFEYARMLGKDVSDIKDVDINLRETDGEIEDSFLKYYQKTKFDMDDIKSLIGQKPITIGGIPSKNSISCRELVAKEVIDLARSKNTTVTALLGGILAYSIIKTREKIDGKKSIILMIPVDYRRIFPSVSMRNFVFFIRICIKPQQWYTLNDYITMVHDQMVEATKKENLQKDLSTVVKGGKSFILKICPLFLKMAIAKFSRLFLKTRQTIIFSNLGKVDIDKRLDVDKIMFNLNVSKNATTNLASISTNGEMVLAFSKSVSDDMVENKVFNMIESLGCDVKYIEKFQNEDINND